MVRSLSLVAACCSALLMQAQNFTDLQFNYDSLLNVNYGSATNFNGAPVDLHMDVFWPQCSEGETVETRPLLLLIHGGAWLAGSKDDASIQALCRSFARRGYVTATIDYRLGFIADDALWQCNFPEYNCVFAGESGEWHRSYFRAMQDAKGALRYLVNRHEEFNIDTANVFVAGESAGAFVALAVGLLDMESEKPLAAFAQDPLPVPHPSMGDCSYNEGMVTNGMPIARPDLGSIDGSIEPTTINFTIKGIGNMYGGMFSNLLADIPEGKTKPAIFSFHQNCDIVVPIDSNRVYWGLSWCFTNGYNCFAINNNQHMVYGSRTFSNWNTENNHGYTLENQFTGPNFPFNFLFGEGSCLDQVDNPCHAYDNAGLRESQLASFFANLVSTGAICSDGSGVEPLNASNRITVHPNPSSGVVNLKGIDNAAFTVVNTSGTTVCQGFGNTINLSGLADGVYIIAVQTANQTVKRRVVLLGSHPSIP